MTAMTISAAVLQSLQAAGPQGISQADLWAQAEKLRGQSIRWVAISNAICELKLAQRAVIKTELISKARTYKLTSLGTFSPARSHHVVADVFQAPPSLPAPASITAAVCGDPLPGRSALDQRRAAHL